jgi:hypothetical protein
VISTTATRTAPDGHVTDVRYAVLTGRHGRMPRFVRPPLIPRPAASLEKLRDELTDAVNYLEVRLFPVPGFSFLGMRDSARFAYISHRPDARASRKADGLSKFPDAILPKKLQCFSVRSQVSRSIHCGRGPARYSPQVLELE